MEYDKQDSSMKLVYDYYDLITEHRKKQGITKTQVYTPPQIVDHIVNSTIPLAVEKFREEKRPLLELNIMDPCCGSGIFLLAAVRKMHELTHLPKKDIIENNIHGIDIDLGAVNATKQMLDNEAGTKCKNKIYWGDFLCDFFLKSDKLKHIRNLAEIDELNKYFEKARNIYLTEYDKHIKNPDPTYARAKGIHAVQSHNYKFDWEPKFEKTS